MFQCGYVFLLMAVCFSCMTEEIGALRQKRLIGGQKFNKGDFPHLVSLWTTGNNPLTQYNGNGDIKHSCGGALIHESWVLTAAHIFAGENNDPKKWKVYLGMHQQTNAANAQIRGVRSIIIPNEYSPTALSSNIALVKLDSPATLDTSVMTIPFSNKNDCPKENEHLTVVGWGQETFDASAPSMTGPTTNEPRKLEMQVVSQQTCNQSYNRPEVKKAFKGFESMSIDDTIICAGVEEKSPCGGDAGNPATARCGNKDVLVGVAVFAYKCAQPNSPTGFTKVSAFQKWISDTINANAS